jgi:predicted aspartyl protease
MPPIALVLAALSASVAGAPAPDEKSVAAPTMTAPPVAPERPSAEAASPAAKAIGLPTGDAETIATRAIAQSRLGVDVKLGGTRDGITGPYRFLVDTGAQNTVLGANLAQKLAIEPGRTVTVSSVAGLVTVQTVVLDELMLGKRSYYGLLAPLLEERNIGADGIVGVDSLQGQRVLIDFRRNTLVVDDGKMGAAAADYEIVVTARRRSGQLIMTDARIEGVRVAVVIDTGADVTVGNLALQTALGKRGAALTPTALTSVTGQTVMTNMAAVRRLDINGLSIGSFNIAFTDAPPFRSLGLEKQPAILLGMHELRAFPRIAIDFPARRVLFDLPDPGMPAGSTIAGY